jgi:hypothetical protein
MRSMSTPRTLLRATTPLLVLAGCGGDDPAPASIRTDSAGIEIVTYPGPDRPSALTPREELRLGGREDDPNQSFFRVAAGTVGADGAGNIYVLDYSANRVVVFDAEGNFVRTMGREGGGPGELGIAAGLLVDPDGSVGVIDFSKRGIVRFDPAGEPLPLQPIPPGFYGGRVVSADGALFVTARKPGDNGPAAEALYRMTATDTTELASLALPAMKPIRLESCGMGFSGMPPLFNPTLRWDALGDRGAVVTGEAYDIAVLEGGREVRRIHRDIAPTPATEALALRQVGEAMQVRTEGGVRRCAPDEVVEQQGFAPVIPAITTVAISPDGRLWVQRGGVRDEPKAIDIYSPDGEYEGTLPAGSPFPILFLPDGRIGAAETDELDVTRLVVYAVDRPVVGERS